jgi:hypothetical protein
MGASDVLGDGVAHRPGEDQPAAASPARGGRGRQVAHVEGGELRAGLAQRAQPRDPAQPPVPVLIAQHQTAQDARRIVAEPGDRLDIERHHPGRPTIALERAADGERQRLDMRRRGFDLDQHWHSSTHTSENIAEPRNGFMTVAQTDRRQLAGAALLDVAGRRGHPIERRVMEDEGLAVAAQANIDLDAMAKRDGGVDRGAAVLGRVRTMQAAMGEGRATKKGEAIGRCRRRDQRFKRGQ